MANLTGNDYTNVGKVNTDKAGTVSSVAVALQGDEDSGLYQPAAGQVAVSSAGVQSGLFEATAFTVPGTITMVGVLSGVTTVSFSGVATALAGVSLGDGTTAAGAVLKSKKVTITSTQVLALAAAPQELVAAVASTYLVFVSALIELDKGATAYDDAAADGDLVIRYTNGSGEAIAFIEADGFIDSATDDVRFVGGQNEDEAGANANLPITPVVNSAIVLDNNGAEFTGGDGALDIVINYYEITSQL